MKSDVGSWQVQVIVEKQVLHEYLSCVGIQLYNCMLGQWALLAYIVIVLLTPNRVVATPNRVKASNKA